jgi:hypothetical protein
LHNKNDTLEIHTKFITISFLTGCMLSIFLHIFGCMKLKFINPEALDKNLKATVHKSGKLGFTMDAARKLKLGEGKSASIAINEDDVSDENLYVVIHEGLRNDAYKISKAGQYYYINTKALLDHLKINYLKQNVVFDISREFIENQTVFKFKRRPMLKKMATDNAGTI